MDPAVMENMFKVDLLAVVWIGIAILVVTILATHFYRGLEAGSSQARRPARDVPSSPRLRWLGWTLGGWWAADAVWHGRAVVVTPPFWHPQLAQISHHNLPWFGIAARLWTTNPILWDFTVVVVDSIIVVWLTMSPRQRPPWLAMAAIVWGVVRWALAGCDASWGHWDPIGPGGYLIGAATAYLILFPQQYRMVLAGLAAWLAADALWTAHGPHAPNQIALAVGLAGLALGALRQWSRRAFRILALSVTIEVMAMGVGLDFLRIGMNHLWAPALLLLALGLHVQVGATRTAKPLGG